MDVEGELQAHVPLQPGKMVSVASFTIVPEEFPC